MASWKDPVFEKWWPLGQSLTLVHAPIRRVARAMKAEGKRAYRSTGAVYEFDWIQRQSIDDLFSNVEKFTIGGTVEIALPTRGEWTVIFDNSSLCTPSYLAHRLAFFYKLEAISFYCTDRNSTQLAGTHFTHHRPCRGEDVIKRDVYCCNQGSRWHFQQHGDPLPEEDLEKYAIKRKRDRLNEAGLMSLLERLGVHPWREDTYNFRKKLLRMTDKRQFPTSEKSVTFDQVRARAMGEAPPPEEDQELDGPPDYLHGKCDTPNPSGPAKLLRDGNWRGHGEQMYWIYDIFTRKNDLFTVRLPEPDGVPVVEITPKSGDSSIVIYDGRRHPANVFFGSDREPVLKPNVECPKCRAGVFRASVGFEVPADAESANDTSWFALALECEACGLARIAYEDETA